MNLYDLSGSGSDAEKFDQLLSRDGVSIERIISHGQATPEGDWYDQDWDEWVSGPANTNVIVPAGGHFCSQQGRMSMI